MWTEIFNTGDFPYLSKFDDDTYLEDQDGRLFIGISHTEVTPVNIELAKYAKMPNRDSDSEIKKTSCDKHFKAGLGSW